MVPLALHPIVSSRAKGSLTSYFYLQTGPTPITTTNTRQSSSSPIPSVTQGITETAVAQREESPHTSESSTGKKTQIQDLHPSALIKGRVRHPVIPSALTQRSPTSDSPIHRTNTSVSRPHRTKLTFPLFRNQRCSHPVGLHDSSEPWVNHAFTPLVLGI